jgi:methylmalonyl-CoA/ethylmalonyl-CoA epimerase
MPEDARRDRSLHDAVGAIAPLVQGASLDHVAVAVRDLSAAARLFRDVLGGEFLMGSEIEHQSFRFVQYRLPAGGKFELVTPMAEGFVSRFLERRGEGVHHVTLRVERIEEQIERLRAGGVNLTLVNLSNPHWKEAFIHPSNAQGVLVQLAESAHSEDEAARHLGERFGEAMLLGGGKES